MTSVICQIRTSLCVAERQAVAIRAIRDVEIEHTLTALSLLCSYFTEEQMQTPVLGFFKDNLPDLSIARNEESGEIELKWNDSDGVDVNDSILKRLSMGFPDLYNSSRPSLGGYSNGMIDDGLVIDLFVSCIKHSTFWFGTSGRKHVRNW